MATHFIVSPVIASTRQLRVVVVDSQRSVRQAITRVIESDSSIQVVIECASGAEAQKAIAQHRPDVLFIETGLPDASAFDLVASAPNVPAIVFLSAQARDAAQAFDAHAVDFLVKPFRDERVMHAFLKAKLKLQAESGHAVFPKPQMKQDPDAEQRTGSPFVERITLRNGKAKRIEKVQAIDCFTAAANYVTVHCKSKSFRIRSSMKVLETQLNPREFVRIHRSTIVNLEYVQEFQLLQTGDYLVKLRDGKELKMSRSYRAHFKKALSNLKCLM